MRKRLWVPVAAALLVGAVGAFPAAEAGPKRKACKKVKVAVPGSLSTDAAAAQEVKVVKVTEKATEDKPLVVDFAHEAALADSSLPQFPAEDPKFFNFQLDTKANAAVLHVKIEWPAPSPSDIDLFLFDSPTGALIDSSVAYNPLATDAYNSLFGGDDGNGLEQIRDLGFARCSGVTVESRPASTPGESAMKLSVWLD